MQRWTASLSDRNRLFSEKETGAKPVSAVTPCSCGESRDLFHKLAVSEPSRRERVAFARLHCLCLLLVTLSNRN